MNGEDAKYRNDVWFAAIMLLAVLGVICGAFIPAGSVNAGDAASAVLNAAKGQPLYFAANSFRTLAVLVAVCFVCGFSAVMQPAEAAVPFFFGTGFGLASAQLCRDTASTGSFLMIVPGGVLSAAVLSFAAREAMRMSSAVFRRTFMPSEYEPADFTLYLKKFALISAMAAGAAAVDGFSAFVCRFIGGSAVQAVR